MSISRFLVVWDFHNKGLSFFSSVRLLMLTNSQKRFFVWQFQTSTLIFLHFSWFNSYSKGDDSRLYSATDPFDYNTSIFFASERRCHRKVKEWYWFCFLPVLKMIFLYNCQGDFHQSNMWQLVNSTRIFELNLLFFGLRFVIDSLFVKIRVLNSLNMQTWALPQRSFLRGSFFV